MSKLTTATSIPRGLDLSRLDTAVASGVKNVNGGEVTYRYGTGSLTLGGDYVASANGTITSGTVDSLTFYTGPKAIFTLSGIDIEGAVAGATLSQFPGATLFAFLMSGADTITGSKWRDVLNGQGGNDVIKGGGSGDLIHGGDGNDALYGQNGIDMIYGDGGNDHLFGGFGDDLLSGGTGRDQLLGLGGNDTLTGGAGFDRLTGGNGNDAFVFDGGFGRDRVNDFEAGDHIVLGDKYWNGMSSAANLVKAYGEINDQGDAVLTFGKGDSVVFVGVAKLADLTGAIEHIDFI